jgi:hypothetical protein
MPNLGDCLCRKTVMIREGGLLNLRLLDSKVPHLIQVHRSFIWQVALGGSGIASARGSRFPLFMAMREFGDVIALDQRGVGQSKPNLVCRESYDLPLDESLTREEAIRVTRERSRSCAETWRG